MSVCTTYGALRFQHKMLTTDKVLPLRPLLLTVAVSVWGIRLGSFLFNRILNSPEDNRLTEFFPKKGELPIKLAGFWNIQACWAFFSLLPVTMAHRMPPPKGWPSALGRAATVAGWSLFAAGLACEAVADYQKSQFKARPGVFVCVCGVCICAWCLHAHAHAHSHGHTGAGTHTYTHSHARTNAGTFSQATAAPSATRACGTTAGIPTTSAS